MSRLFAGEAVSESVATCVHFDAAPEAVWDRLVLYEEVPRRPPLLLRALLPSPLRTEGDKTRVGERVRCVYRGGDVVKLITVIEPERLLQFDVVEQNLGIEDCVLTQGGAYRFSACGDGTDVALATDYRAYLHPRGLWRRFEASLVRRLHRHILEAVGATLFPARSPVPGGSSPRHRRGAAGGVAWTASRSCSHRSP